MKSLSVLAMRKARVCKKGKALLSGISFGRMQALNVFFRCARNAEGTASASSALPFNVRSRFASRRYPQVRLGETQARSHVDNAAFDPTPFLENVMLADDWRPFSRAVQNPESAVKIEEESWFRYPK
jgi:hypothetical protein